MTNYSFSKRERVTGAKRISQLFESGEGGFVYPFRYLYRVYQEEVDESEVALVISVPKRNHKLATSRNRLKRRTREAFRLNQRDIFTQVKPSRRVDIALIYAVKEAESYSKIEDGVKKIITKIAKGL